MKNATIQWRSQASKGWRSTIVSTRSGPVDMMSIGANERDMIVMHHEFIAEFPGGKKELLTSTLLDYGIPGDDTSIARTVSLPAAIAVKMILDGKITEKGCHVPVSPGIYNPILDALEPYNVIFKERKEEL